MFLEHPLLTSASRELIASLCDELCILDLRIEAMGCRIQRVFAKDPLTATAIVAVG